MSIKRVVWSPDRATDFSIVEHEVDRELPDDRALRLYGAVTEEPTGHDATSGGPTGTVITVHVIGASFWDTGCIEGRTLDSLDSITTLSGLTLEDIGEAIHDAHLDSLVTEGD